MATKTLAVPYHQQDFVHYCGAASSQMLVSGTGGPLELQDDLYNEGHGASTIDQPPVAWFVAPDGLTTTLNTEPHPAFPGSFSPCEMTSCDTASRKIVWAIFHHGVAPVALVEDGAHWVVVHGYSTTADPTSSTDTSFGICGFDIKDPWPPATRLHPRIVPPHSATDGCGTSKKRGLSTQFIVYSKWKTDYMTAMPHGSPPSHWAGKFVAVCDPDPAPLTEGTAVCTMAKKKLKKRSRRTSTGVGLLEKRDAGVAALDGLRHRQDCVAAGMGHYSDRADTRGSAARAAAGSGRQLLLPRADFEWTRAGHRARHRRRVRRRVPSGGDDLQPAGHAPVRRCAGTRAVHRSPDHAA